jgi:hypothetical protein
MDYINILLKVNRKYMYIALKLEIVDDDDV